MMDDQLCARARRLICGHDQRALSGQLEQLAAPRLLRFRLSALRGAGYIGLCPALGCLRGNVHHLPMVLAKSRASLA